MESLGGLGLVLEDGGEGVYVSGLIKGSDAEKCGRIRAGDILVKVDGRDVRNSTIRQVVLLAKGGGEVVSLSFERQDSRSSSIKAFTIPLRRQLPLKNISGGGYVGYSSNAVHCTKLHAKSGTWTHGGNSSYASEHESLRDSQGSSSRSPSPSSGRADEHLARSPSENRGVLFLGRSATRQRGSTPDDAHLQRFVEALVQDGCDNDDTILNRCALEGFNATLSQTPLFQIRSFRRHITPTTKKITKKDTTPQIRTVLSSRGRKSIDTMPAERTTPLSASSKSPAATYPGHRDGPLSRGSGGGGVGRSSWRSGSSASSDSGIGDDGKGDVDRSSEVIEGAFARLLDLLRCDPASAQDVPEALSEADVRNVPQLRDVFNEARALKLHHMAASKVQSEDNKSFADKTQTIINDNSANEKLLHAANEKLVAVQKELGQRIVAYEESQREFGEVQKREGMLGQRIKHLESQVDELQMQLALKEESDVGRDRTHKQLQEALERVKTLELQFVQLEAQRAVDTQVAVQAKAESAAVTAEAREKDDILRDLVNIIASTSPAERFDIATLHVYVLQAKCGALECEGKRQWRVGLELDQQMETRLHTHLSSVTKDGDCVWNEKICFNVDEVGTDSQRLVIRLLSSSVDQDAGVLYVGGDTVGILHLPLSQLQGNGALHSTQQWWKLVHPTSRQVTGWSILLSVVYKQPHRASVL